MRGEAKQNNKSNITIATNNKIFDEIKKDAEIQGISINAKINSILTKHVMFYRFVEETEGVILPRNFMKGIVEMSDEEKLVKLLDEAGGNETIPAMFAHNNIPMTMDSLIKYFFEGVSLWAGAYNKFRYHKDEDGRLCLVLEHKFGKKYSRILGDVMAHFITHMVGSSVNVTAMPSTIVLRIEN